MKYCYKGLLIIVFIFSAMAMRAQVDANAIIEKASELYAASTGMKATFSANVRSDKSNVNESFEGNISMKNNKFLLQTPDMQVWYDGTTQWMFTRQTQEVNISTPKGSDLQMLNPIIILQNYKKAFNIAYAGESTSDNAKAAHDIALTPKKKDDIERIDIQIEKLSSLPARIVITMTNGMKATIRITGLKKDMDYPDSMFVFQEKDYPNIEIIDLR